MSRVSGKRVLMAFTEREMSVPGRCFDWRRNGCGTRQSLSLWLYAWSTPPRLMKCFQRNKRFPGFRHVSCFRWTNHDKTRFCLSCPSRTEYSSFSKLSGENTYDLMKNDKWHFELIVVCFGVTYDQVRAHKRPRYSLIISRLASIYYEVAFCKLISFWSAVFIWTWRRCLFQIWCKTLGVALAAIFFFHISGHFTS